jgi:PAS domain S-box-containing protein
MKSEMNVLLLEDSELDAELIEVELRKRGIQARLHRVWSERELLHALETPSWDVILSDFNMPGFDGLRGLALLKEKKLDIPFIIVSGTLGEERAVAAMKAGASDYIVKGHLARLVPAIERETSEARLRREHREGQAALAASEANLKSLVENSIVGIYVIQGDRFVYVNPAVAEVAGYTQQELTSRPLIDFVWPSDRRLVQDNVKKRIDGESDRIRYNVTMQRKDGKPVHVEVQGARTHYDGKPSILGVLLDTTMRKQAEERFKTIFQANPFGIAVSSCLTGRVVETNQAFLSMIGEERGSVVGKSILDRGFAEEKGEAGKIALAVRGGLRLEKLPARLRIRSAEKLQLLISSEVIELGEDRCTIFFFDNVTEQKTLEAQLLRNQRMDSIGALAGGIAHDLNNALAPILMSVELLRMRFHDPESTQTLNVLQTSAQRGADMVKQVLTFARGIDGERRSVQVRHLIRDLGEMMRHTFPKSIAIKEVVEKGVPPVMAEATQLHQVLLNLCVNARDAMPSGGILTIGAKPVDLDASTALRHGSARRGPHLLVTVSDTGSGIPPHVQERMFEPFFTTKEPGKGTGLGLSTVQSILKQHDGFLTFQTAENCGTEFQVFLPVESTALTSGESDSRASLPMGHGELVLIVDDEALVCDMARQILEAFGYSVLMASNGAEAVALCAKQAGKIRLMITDLSMPVMDGQSAIRAVQVIDPDLPIVVASGSWLDNTKERPGQIRAVLEKPYTPEKLLRTVHEVLVGQPAPVGN